MLRALAAPAPASLSPKAPYITTAADPATDPATDHTPHRPAATVHPPGPPPARPQYVKIGIADPTINWIDLGASRRSAKTAIGFTGYPVSIYIRCKNSVQEALYSQMMSYYFKPGDLINDP